MTASSSSCVGTAPGMLASGRSPSTKARNARREREGAHALGVGPEHRWLAVGAAVAVVEREELVSGVGAADEDEALGRAVVGVVAALAALDVHVEPRPTEPVHVDEPDVGLAARAGRIDDEPVAVVGHPPPFCTRMSAR